MHSISIVSGNITSTGFSRSKEDQVNAQSSSSSGGFAVNRQRQDEDNGQRQAAFVTIASDVGGETPEPAPEPVPDHYPFISIFTQKVRANSGTDNLQGQALYQDALVTRGCRPLRVFDSIFDGEEGRGPLARNQGTQNQLSDQQSDSDVNIKHKVGDPLCEPVKEFPKIPPPDPQIIVDDSESTSETNNEQNQFAGQNAEVTPQKILDDGHGAGVTDPAINELDQNQDAAKRTSANHNVEMIVAPGGRHDPLRQGVGPTFMSATNTFAGARSANLQNQGYEQSAAANSGLLREYADNDAVSRQNNDSNTNANNRIAFLYRTNTIAPVNIVADTHAAMAEDLSEQNHSGTQTASSSGPLSRARSQGRTGQDNSQLTRSGMTVFVNA